MNKSVNFEIAKLIKQKGFNDTVTRRYNYLGKLSKYTQFPENYNTEIWGDEISAPTIAEVLMWLFEKHSIWFYVYFQHSIYGFFYELCDTKSEDNTVSIQEKDYKDNGEQTFKTPNECYEAAIEYTLKNLI